MAPLALGTSVLTAATEPPTVPTATEPATSRIWRSREARVLLSPMTRGGH